MRGYDQNFADSEAGYYYAYGAFPAIPSGQTAYPVQSDLSSPALFNIPTFGHYNSPSRVSEFKRELAEMLKADPTGGAVPNLLMIKYSNDHTQGYSTSAANKNPLAPLRRRRQRLCRRPDRGPDQPQRALEQHGDLRD